MKTKIIARDKEHLVNLIRKEIKMNGDSCDLNHIDVSNVKDMAHLFCTSRFNGNIDQWDVSNVRDMGHMFRQSIFNGDISQWDVSKVIDMWGMFAESTFNQDISQWNVCKVYNMSLSLIHI